MDKQRLRSDVIQAEGYKLVAYKDTKGLWTGGVGHLLPQNRDWSGVRFDVSQVLAWLDADMASAEALAAALPEWASLDTDSRQNAVVELVFNLGPDRWKGFHKTRDAIQKKEWPVAHDELLASKWAEQVGPTRSTRIANYLRSGTFSA